MILNKKYRNKQGNPDILNGLLSPPHLQKLDKLVYSNENFGKPITNTVKNLRSIIKWISIIAMKPSGNSNYLYLIMYL